MDLMGESPVRWDRRLRPPSGSGKAGGDGRGGRQRVKLLCASGKGSTQAVSRSLSQGRPSEEAHAGQEWMAHTVSRVSGGPGWGAHGLPERPRRATGVRASSSTPTQQLRQPTV